MKQTGRILIFLLFNLFQGEFTTGGESYVKALELIRDEEKTLQLATLYQRLGYNLYTRGIYAESIKYVITQTYPCNILQYFTVVKMVIFK